MKRCVEFSFLRILKTFFLSLYYRLPASLTTLFRIVFFCHRRRFPPFFGREITAGLNLCFYFLGSAGVGPACEDEPQGRGGCGSWPRLFFHPARPGVSGTRPGGSGTHPGGSDLRSRPPSSTQHEACKACNKS